MVKRTSRENAKDRKASEDLSDDSNSQPSKKIKYDLRKRKTAGGNHPPVHDNKKNKKEEKEEILWINDDTLSDSESDDEEIPMSLNIHIHKTEPDWGGEEDDFLNYIIEKYSIYGRW